MPLSQTKANFSRKGLQADDAVLIAADIESHSALISLDLSDNAIRGWETVHADRVNTVEPDSAGISALSSALAANHVLRACDVRHNGLTGKHTDLDGRTQLVGEKGMLCNAVKSRLDFALFVDDLESKAWSK